MLRESQDVGIQAARETPSCQIVLLVGEGDLDLLYKVRRQGVILLAHGALEEPLSKEAIAFSFHQREVDSAR